MDFKITKYAFAGLLFLSSSAWAQSASELLRNDLQKVVKSLPQETSLYHYFNLDLGGYAVEATTLIETRGRQDYVHSRLALGGKAFRDFNRRSTAFSNAGPGIYLAVDPFASSPAAAEDSGGNFGDSMIEIKMRPEAKYLSVFAPAAVSSGTVNALIAEGYLNRETAQRLLKGNRFSRDTLKFMVGYGVEDFRKLVADLLLEMNVSMIEYAWQTGVSPLCSWKDLRSAFVYIATELPADVSEATLVHWKGFPNTVVLSEQESQALERNKALRPLLAELRVLEKKMKATKGTAARNAIRQEAQSAIKATYSGPANLWVVKQRTFQCL